MNDLKERAEMLREVVDDLVDAHHAVSEAQVALASARTHKSRLERIHRALVAWWQASALGFDVDDEGHRVPVASVEEMRQRIARMKGPGVTAEDLADALSADK